MAEKRRFSPPAVGGGSLLVIFAVLCLVTFALLSLSTVSADLRLAEKSRDYLTAFYEADGEAERMLAALRAGETPEGVTVTETPRGFRCQYQCTLPPAQRLSVEAEVVGKQVKILRWQVVSAETYPPETTITVWDGQQEREGG